MNNDKYEVLKITYVEVFLFGDDSYIGKTKGIAQVALNDQIILRGIKITEGLNGPFISYPRDPYNIKDRSVFSPVTRQFKESLEDAVLTEYAKKREAKK